MGIETKMVLAFRFTTPHLDQAIGYWRLVGILGAIDLGLTVGFVITNLLWVEDGSGIPIPLEFMLLLSVPHTYTWISALLAGTQVPSTPFMLFCYVSYFVSFTLDLGNFVGRLVLVTSSSSQLTFQWVCFALAILMAANSFVGLLMFGPLMANYREHEYAVHLTLEEREKQIHFPGFALAMRKVSKELYESRNTLRILGQLDLYLTILLAVMYSLGFAQMTPTFQWLTFAQTLHVFMWVISASVSEGAESSWVLRGFFAVLGADIGLSIGSDIWRVVLAVQCLTAGTPSVPNGCSFLAPFAWIIVAVVMIMVALDSLQIFTMVRLLRGLKETEKDIDTNLGRYLSPRGRQHTD